MPPCYIDIPTQNFLLILETGDVVRKEKPPHLWMKVRGLSSRF